MLHRVPLIHEVDVLIVGAGSGVVAAAVEARTAGARVLAVSDRSYFGEESAGTLRLATGRRCDDPLFQQLFPAGAEAPPYPGRIKHQLEQTLLDAGIPFLFYARPVALLQDDSGLCGALLASRTSLYAVGFKVAIDATRHGLLAQLARVPLPGQRGLSATLECILLAPMPPHSPQYKTHPAAATFKQTLNDGQAMDVPAHRLVFDRPAHDDTIAGRSGVEHLLRSRMVHKPLWGAADVIPDHPSRHIAAASVDDVASLDVVECRADERLLLMNGLLPLSAAALQSLDEPAVQIPLGRRFGRAAADLAAAQRRETNWSAVRVLGDDNPCDALGFAPSFVRRGRIVRMLELRLGQAPVIGRCDVAVAGGGTGGAAAGISAARAGASTIVLEMLHGLGGVGTLGLIAAYWFGNRVGFSNELDQRVVDLAGGDAQNKGATWNPYLKDLACQQALREASGSAWFGSFAYGVRRDGDRVTGLLVSTPFGAGLLETGAVVDATGSADVAAAAGAACRVIDHRHVGVQGAGLPPRKPGVDHRNTDYTFVDDSDAVGVTHAFVNARAKFRDDFDVAPLVDTRERRQIRGDLELSPLDILAGRTFPDTVVTARSNFDTHGFTVHPVFFAVVPDKKPLSANVPFRAMLPAGVEGVVVTGLGMSAHRDALPVVRMQADVQNQGYAAGVAAARSAKSAAPLRRLDIRALQRHLVDVGILDPQLLEQGDSFPLSAAAIAAAVAADPLDPANIATLVAHPEQSVPLLRKALAAASSDARREALAQVLGLLGDAGAAETLAAIVAAEPWDQGWNYTGMGQFGRSMSRLDSLIIALSQTGSPLAVGPIAEKIAALDADAAFSHCRAVSVATSRLGDERLKRGLARLLALPGMQGHAHLSTADVIRTADSNGTETASRNVALRELLLARGLYLTGDIDGIGRRILETYSADLRGPLARHAQALLEITDFATARREVI